MHHTLARMAHALPLLRPRRTHYTPPATEPYGVHTHRFRNRHTSHSPERTAIPSPHPHAYASSPRPYTCATVALHGRVSSANIAQSFGFGNGESSTSRPACPQVRSCGAWAMDGYPPLTRGNNGDGGMFYSERFLRCYARRLAVCSPAWLCCAACGGGEFLPKITVAQGNIL